MRVEKTIKQKLLMLIVFNVVLRFFCKTMNVKKRFDSYQKLRNMNNLFKTKY